jgi:hypothetical protein
MATRTRTVLVRYGDIGRKVITIPADAGYNDVVYLKKEFLKIVNQSGQLDFIITQSTGIKDLILKKYDADFDEEVDIAPDHVFEDRDKNIIVKVINPGKLVVIPSVNIWLILFVIL